MIDIVSNIYLSRLFNWVIETSIMASILTILILIVRTLLRNKLTPRWYYLLWMILIVRLLLPWSPDSSYSIYSILSYGFGVSVQSQSFDSLVNQSEEEKTGILGKKGANGDERHPAILTLKENNYIPTQNDNQMNNRISFHTVALYLWLLGILVLSLVTYFVNRRLFKNLQQNPVITDKRIIGIFHNCQKSMSVSQRIPLLLNEKISSPTVLGFIKPKILLSSVYVNRLSDQQLRHIFVHELTHIKRRDVAFNWIMHGLLIINWFNPILWWAYISMREDQELACDAYALTFMVEEEKILYGHTVISLLEHYSNYYQMPSLANLSRNKRNIKRRILMIKEFNKKSYRWSALGVVTLVAVASLSLVNAQAVGSNEKQKITQTNALIYTPTNTPSVNNTPQAIITKDNKDILSAHETSQDGLAKIKQHAPFKVLVPDKLPLDKLNGAFMTNARQGTSLEHVDLFFDTTNGPVHIWQSNVDNSKEGKDPINIPGVKQEKVTIGNHDWYYSVRPDDADKIFKTRFGDITVAVDGFLPYDQMVDIVSSLK